MSRKTSTHMGARFRRAANGEWPGPTRHRARRGRREAAILWRAAQKTTKHANGRDVPQDFTTRGPFDPDLCGHGSLGGASSNAWGWDAHAAPAASVGRGQSTFFDKRWTRAGGLRHWAQPSDNVGPHRVQSVSRSIDQRLAFLTLRVGDRPVPERRRQDGLAGQQFEGRVGSGSKPSKKEVDSKSPSGARSSAFS